MPRKIDPAVKEPASRLVTQHRGEHSSLSACCEQVARQEGPGKETVHRWTLQADVDAGTRDGVTTEEREEIRRLKAENKRLAESQEIMRNASNFSQGELDPAAGNLRFHRLEET